MSMSEPSSVSEPLPPDAEGEIDALCDRFDAEWRGWRAGRPPVIEDYLGRVAGELRAPLLRALLPVELEYRRGEGAGAEEYRRRLPGYEAVVDSAFAEAAGDGSSDGPTPRAGPPQPTELEGSGPEPDRMTPGPSGWEGAGELPRLELSDADEPLALLARAGRYLVEGLVAPPGGMGVVLRARDPGLNRTLAVKVLRKRYQGQPELVHRFVEEAQITGQLQHPGIPPVHEVGSLGEGQPFLAMKLIQGQTLDHLLKGRTGPSEDLPRWLAAFLQICQAVAYAHSRGVVHRDLKPGNVMVDDFGDVQVMDWGLAKVRNRGGGAGAEEASIIAAARGAEEETEHGRALGTFAYMAPEQARGEVGQVDDRSDVFGLGAILCAILTGQPPYRGGSQDEVRRLAEAGDVADAFARLEASGADWELVALAKACLAPEKEGRPRDARVVARQVAAYQAAVQERLRAAELERAAADARAAEARAKAVAERRARRFQVGLVAAVLLLVVGASLTGVWYARRRADRAREVAAREAEVTASLERALALGRQAEALDDDPYRQEGPLAAALAAAREARGIALSGGSSEELPQRVDGILAGLEQAEADRRFVLDVEEIRLQQADLSGDHRNFDSARAAPLYAAAFRKHGLDVLSLPSTTTAERLRRHRRRGALVAVLVDWARGTRAAAERERLEKILGGVEPDGGTFGSRWRRALKRRDRVALRKLAGSGEVTTLPAGSLLHLAEDLGGAGDGPAAERLLREGLRRFPNDFWLHEGLGLVLLGSNPPQPEEAARFLTAAAALRPRSPGAHYNLGNALRAKKDLEGAIRCYERAIQLDPDLASAYTNMGLALRAKKDLEGAIRCYERAIQLDPNLAPAHSSLGVALHDKKDLEGAIRCYNKAIKLDPRYAPAHTSLGNALADKKDLAGAIRCHNKAIELAPNDAKAHYNLGVALGAKGRPDEAIRCYQTAIKLDPHYAKAHCNLGVALHKKKDLAGAIGCYNKAIELDPNDAKAHLNLGFALRAKGDLDGAIRCYQTAIKVAPKSDPALGGAYVNLGALLCDDKKDYEGAIIAFRQAIALDPNDATTHFNLGNALRGKGRLDEAIACYQRAITLDPHYAPAHTNLGNALAAKGDLAGAIRCHKHAINIAPNLAEAHYNLGFALHRQGNLEGAIRSYRLGVEIDPKLAPAHGALGQALMDQGRFSEARSATRCCLALLPVSHPLRKGVSQQLEWCERLAGLEDKLAAILKGTAEPRDAAESLTLAWLCQQPYKQLYARSARLYTRGFAEQPRLANDLRGGNRYNAACAAALAAARKGKDAGKLDDAERARLRQQALDWLRADLAGWVKVIDKGPPSSRSMVQRTLRHWEKDSDLAGVRDKDALAKLPAEGRSAWRKLWAEVDDLLKRAETR